MLMTRLDVTISVCFHESVHHNFDEWLKAECRVWGWNVCFRMMCTFIFGLIFIESTKFLWSGLKTDPWDFAYEGKESNLVKYRQSLIQDRDIISNMNPLQEMCSETVCQERYLSPALLLFLLHLREKKANAETVMHVTTQEQWSVKLRILFENYRMPLLTP